MVVPYLVSVRTFHSLTSKGSEPGQRLQLFFLPEKLKMEYSSETGHAGVSVIRDLMPLESESGWEI